MTTAITEDSRMGWGYDNYYPPYVSVAKRKANATREMAKLKKKGQTITPVKLEGRKIATTFWGKAWCDHMESYSDFYSRLERGRTYVRNGSVVNLQILPGQVTAHVAGSELYTVSISIQPVADKLWNALRNQCAGQINSIVELLQGKLSTGVMQIMTHRDKGLFPDPAQIRMKCSCPDYAGMCKHIAAVLYGVGARLDQQPELLFTLRKVDHMQLIESAGDVSAITAGTCATGKKTIAMSQLADVFGIDIETDIAPPAATNVRARSKTTSKPTAKTKAKRNGKVGRSKSAPTV
jgi:uncharacterized Zn finger protein